MIQIVIQGLIQMRLQNLFLIVLFLFVWGELLAKDAFYPVTDIPTSLLTNANSVVRKSDINLEIFAKDKIKYSFKEIISILNENGEGEGVLYIPYDSNSDVEIEVANIYDKYGTLIKKVKKSEIYDQASFDGFSLYTDARFKRITPQISTYPYTVEYEFTIAFKGAIDYYDWVPCNSYNKSVELSSYRIQLYEEQGVRVKANKYILPEKNGELVDGVTTYLWKLEKMEALEREPMSVSLFEIVPRVVVAPESFSFYGTDGNMSSWKDFGNWVYSLIEDKNILSDERVAYLKNLTASVEDQAEKVKLVYQFLQDKTRYVSVQLGIGGFEPVSAEKTDEVGYGDCKALSNYMKAMLENIGITSYYTLVRAGSNSGNLDIDFPSQNFNHVILTVPLESDTLFLECTNKFSPFGFLGSFTADRCALLIDEDNSRLIHTNSYGLNDNIWNLKANIDVEESGNATIIDTVKFRALQYEFIEDELRKTSEKQIEDEYKTSKIPGAKYRQIEYENYPDRIPSATRIRMLDVDRLATKMGDRMFIPVNSLNKRKGVPQKTKDRKYSFTINMSYQDSDSVTFTIPEGYKIEFLPEPVQLETEFGMYLSSLKQDENIITYFRYEVRKRGTYPPDKYNEYIKFVKQITDADSQKMIVKKL
ncbi:MAG: DUF3857 domain-containing protein [Marinifilaceae bacterium]|nr:DUF3857 domain-containing protein [Marinifilaceae bacterium]